MGLCQANELELALDVYGQLLREGCTPNLVTYNILIDIHGKMGNWQEAVQVLDALEDQVCHANTPIRPAFLVAPVIYSPRGFTFKGLPCPVSACMDQPKWHCVHIHA